jgi:hypothetical protein
MTTHAEATIDTNDDPFAYTNRPRYVNKSILRDQNVAFEILKVEERFQVPSKNYEPKDIFEITISYEDPKLGRVVKGIADVSIGGPKGRPLPRDAALRAIAKGLSEGKRYPGYYFIGGGTAYTLSKLSNAQRAEQTA